MKPLLFPIVSLTPLVLLIGCGLGTTPFSPTEAGSALVGAVHGGQQPVSGAHVYLMQATFANYGNASTSLITTGDGTDSYGSYVLSGPQGGFTVTGTYHCVPNTQVYAVSMGGNPGLAPGTNNPALALIAALGNCPAGGTFAAQVPFINLNEVTTVTSVYAIAGYMTGTFQVSSSVTPLAATGMANAFLTAGNLASLATGQAYATTPAGNGVVPQSKINTLANILASCVNSDGSVTPPATQGGVGSPCYTLFSNSKTGTITPTDTVSAMLNIAHNPGINIAALFGSISSAAPFTPALTAAPRDFTLSITFTVPGMGNPNANSTHPHNVAVDAAGNVWSADELTNTLGMVNTLGVPGSGPAGISGNGLNAPGGVAIDALGQVYVTNAGASTVSVFTQAGSPRAVTPILTVGLNPKDAAVDTQGNVWITNFGGSSISEFDGAGVQAAKSPFTGNGLNGPAGIAIQPNGNVWITDSASKEIIGFTISGGVVPGSPFSLANEVTPFGIAIDGLGDIWSTNQSTDIFVTNSAGQSILNNPFYANNTYSNAIAIDGAGQAWITDRGLTYLNVLNASGAVLSGTAGFSAGAFAADSIAIDGSGNVWFTPMNQTTLATDHTIREMIGAAAPAITPLATAVAGNTLGTRP